MGQRTAILLKKNFGNNKSTISLIHHQWGIGKTMPAYLTQEILKSVYPLDRSLESLYSRTYNEKDKKLPLDYFYTFEPLNNENNNYITNKEVKTDDPNEDIWNTDVRVRYGKMTDNNNGLMLFFHLYINYLIQLNRHDKLLLRLLYYHYYYLYQLEKLH